MKYKRSLEWYDQAKAMIPSATQTFSKGPTQYPFGVSPIYLERGQGSHVWDVDGNEFIDYPMALGAVLLGHAYPAVTTAIVEQAQKGLSFTLNSTLEVEVAELLTKMIPCAEMVRFGKNGSDATAGAVRAARAYTGREKIVCCGYHGWQDWYISTTTRDQGVPRFNREFVLPFAYNDLESLKRLFVEHRGEIAAVIMEPVVLEEPLPGYLSQVKEIASANGALLIFDEIVTGFRIHTGGAQAYYGVIPDLACVGKGLANGMPLSAVVGRKEVMEVFDEIFFSFTFGGEMLSLAAARATLQELTQAPVIGTMWRLGTTLRDGYNEIARRLKLESVTRCKGLAPRTAITFEAIPEADPLMLRTLFQQEAIARGILAIGVHNLCYRHSEQDIDRTLHAYEETLGIMKQGIDSNDIASRITGKLVEPVFRPLKFDGALARA
ncbi:MAG: aminotransferase class III-fold pyridoxal phosphate-dependent enzyme [Candidatus Omnitrophota bacterium]|nr:aminotransferase class III-fold pyridoxal phosphate-dependent enzyme [Candidatus Omnitrophota bacterium]